MLPQHLQSILGMAQTKRPTSLHTWALAFIAAGQAAVSSLILIYGYRFAGRHDVLWAVVSAVLVVQPGFRQSLTASVTRMVANLVGALTGLIVGVVIKDPTAAVIIALIVVILLCELWRLDLGVRSACASVIIVMMAGEGPLWGTSVHRVIAVAIGCSVAIVVQLLSAPLTRWVERPKPVPVPALHSDE
jgi:uncharacterized membrane protein YgaE (UPF0421/DUF939 family)